jgi:ribosomal protection tetracycline resistance protein
MHRAYPSPNDEFSPGSSGSPTPSGQWLNLGVLAHVDAGKTSLTEALLHAGGAVDQAGSVDAGTTRTDTLALERRRGITIRTAVACFTVGDVTVNLIDTPGHPDFIAEVDRSLAVLDGAVLVLSAVEGVQAQTVVLYRALRRLGIPVFFFINKIDRYGADPDQVVAAVRRRLTSAVVPLGTVRDPGSARADFVPFDLSDRSVAEDATAALADHDPAVLRAWVDHGQLLDREGFFAGLRDLARRRVVQPLSFGSAITGAGVDQLIEMITTVLSAEPADPDTAMSGQVFKVERSPSGDRLCYVRLRTGSLRVRDHVSAAGIDVGKVTGLEVCEPAGFVRHDHGRAGQVVRVQGLSARLGDRLGENAASLPRLHFAPPALETTISARDPEQQLALHQALTEIADVDPLIKLRPDEDHGALRISVYGEVQQQVIADTLALDHGIAVDFRSTKIICIERPAGTGHSVRRMGDPDHLFGATVGVTVGPNRPGAGIELRLEIPRTDIPLHIYSTIEAYHAALLGYLERPLSAGPQGWQVDDIRITVIESGYIPPGPAPADVRHTVEIVASEAIRRSGTVVCELIERFRLEAPGDTLANALNLLARNRAVPEAPELSGSLAVITGAVPTAELDQLRRALHGATHGEGVLESRLDHYAPQPKTSAESRPTRHDQVRTV